MVATRVRIIQYLWKMLGCSGEGIHPPPPHMWVSERFFFLSSPVFPSFLENNVLNFQSYLGRYRQGDSLWICVLQIYLFICLVFILHNRRFGRLSGIKSHRKKYISMIGRVVSVRKCFRMDKIKQESSNRYKALISFAELCP